MSLSNAFPPGQPGPVIERYTRVAPLGLRFWDPVAGAVVGSGLVVTAFLPAQPAQPFNASANRSGVYVFHHLPLLQELENGAGDADYWKKLPPRLAFRIEVMDLEQRFLPMSFTANLPHQGLFVPDCLPVASPLLPTSGLISLFSAPTRTVPAGMAVVRADLHELANGNPVPWAVVEATAAGRAPVHGLSDSQGQVAILFPYPEPQQIGTASPPGPGSPPAGRRSLTDQSWTVKVRVYARHGGFLTSPVSSPLDPAAAAEAIPDLCQVLKQLESPPASAWGSLSPLVPLGDQVLFYGKELLVASKPSPGSAQPSSELMLTLV